MKKVDKYKYLGVYLDEYPDHQIIANTLSGAAGRALGSIISQVKSFGNGCSKLKVNYMIPVVVSILNYCTDVWGILKVYLL